MGIYVYCQPIYKIALPVCLAATVLNKETDLAASFQWANVTHFTDFRPERAFRTAVWSFREGLFLDSDLLSWIHGNAYVWYTWCLDGAIVNLCRFSCFQEVYKLKRQVIITGNIWFISMYLPMFLPSHSPFDVYFPSITPPWTETKMHRTYKPRWWFSSEWEKHKNLVMSSRQPTERDSGE